MTCFWCEGLVFLGGTFFLERKDLFFLGGTCFFGGGEGLVLGEGTCLGERGLVFGWRALVFLVERSGDDLFLRERTCF